MTNTPKDIDAVVEAVVWALQTLTRHEGYAGLGLMDGGIDGDFSVTINLERSGLLYKNPQMDEETFRAFLREQLSDPMAVYR